MPSALDRLRAEIIEHLNVGEVEQAITAMWAVLDQATELHDTAKTVILNLRNNGRLHPDSMPESYRLWVALDRLWEGQ